MEDWLTSILSRIEAGTLVPADYYAKLDKDNALDALDKNPNFEAEWLRVFGEVERRWPVASVGYEARAMAEDIRRNVFLAVSKATGQHEIASYVSEDFELIVKGRLIGINEPLLGMLWSCYDKGEFPAPSR